MTQAVPGVVRLAILGLGALLAAPAVGRSAPSVICLMRRLASLSEIGCGLVPVAPASFVASFTSWCSCGNFSKCGGLK